MTGTFNASDIKNWPNQYKEILWKDARLVLGIKDLKGITENIEIEWNNEKSKFSSGRYHSNMFAARLS